MPATGKNKPTSKPEPVYIESELYDSPEDLVRWTLLAPLLKTWQTEVWEKDHSAFRGCWHYDQEAIRLQWRHKWAVIAAAFFGTGAVVFAILQLGLEGRFYLVEFLKALLGRWLAFDVVNLALPILMYLEIICVVVAVGTILFSIVNSLDHRWRELRFKAEHYRMLKFRFIYDAAHWRLADEEARGLHLFTHLSQIHGTNREKIKEWIHWRREMLPILESPGQLPDDRLAREIAEYFRERRIIPQQKYFQKRGHQLHGVEKIVRWIGPTLFWGSIGCALVHLALHAMHKLQERAAEHRAMNDEDVSGDRQPTSEGQADSPREDAIVPDHKESGPPDHYNQEHSVAAGVAISGGKVEGKQFGAAEESLMVLCALLLALFAAIFPIAAAGIRTWRGAFEFGRNSLRFESMAHHLGHLLHELEKAQTSEEMLAILRRGEYAMESEHRAWMRLMMEAEWFG